MKLFFVACIVWIFFVFSAIAYLDDARAQRIIPGTCQWNVPAFIGGFHGIKESWFIRRRHSARARACDETGWNKTRTWSLQ